MSEDDVKNKVIVPELEGVSIGEAKKIVKDLNLKIEFDDNGSEDVDNKIINEQIPVSGVEVFEESSIIVK